MFHRISEWYKRWRHTRGYGVHSPFAYMIVREVVRPGRDYGYYAYSEIDNAIGQISFPHSRREARILLRLAARMGMRSAFLPNDNRTSPFRAALTGANSEMKITSALSSAPECSLICSTATYIPLETLLGFLTSPGRILAIRDIPDGWREKLFDSLGEGLMLHGQRNIIIFSRPGMQKLAYTIRI